MHTIKMSTEKTQQNVNKDCGNVGLTNILSNFLNFHLTTTVKFEGLYIIYGPLTSPHLMASLECCCCY